MSDRDGSSLHSNNITEASHNTPCQVSDADPQQANYRWGKADQINYFKRDGKELRALLFKTDRSQIGGSLWQDPLYYIQNSPLFHADRAHTLYLTIHNDVA